ncbi:MAG: hypothetical protein KKB20_17850, partial [Proteobacteria bacterium]|nr:hypothetical protein [Pseudomonadota bacterium]
MEWGTIIPKSTAKGGVASATSDHEEFDRFFREQAARKFQNELELKRTEKLFNMLGDSVKAGVVPFNETTRPLVASLAGSPERTAPLMDLLRRQAVVNMGKEDRDAMQDRVNRDYYGAHTDLLKAQAEKMALP